MTAIPSGTKFLGIAASVDTTEKRSKLNNSYQEYYTIGDIADPKEFILTQVNNNNSVIPSTIQDGLIGGKKHYANIDGLSIKYNDIDQQWELYEDVTLMAFISSISDTPDSGYWDLPGGGGGQLYIYNNVINQTSQEFIEDQKAYNLSLSNLQPQVSIVDIESAQILAMGDTPIELLPAPGVGMYYDIEKIIFEYTYGTTPFTSVEPMLQMSDGDSHWNFQTNIITSVMNRVIVTSNPTPRLDLINEDALYNTTATDSAYNLSTYNGTNPTLGDGTLRAIITYNVRTFGA